MCAEFNRITYGNIQKSMQEYKVGREKATTKNYFRYEGKLYPVMNIVKVAIEHNDKITHNTLYDDFSSCKNTLNRLLDNQIVFYKLEEV